MERSEIEAVIQGEVEKLFSLLGNVRSVSVAYREDAVLVSVAIETPQMLIGERGTTLAEIQRLVRLIAKKQTGEYLPIVVDINDYKKQKEAYLRELARTTADEVSLLKREKELAPMPPAERRVIHEELSSRQDVMSESAGDGEDRRVVVKLRPKG